MHACIGALICLEAVTDFKDVFSLKSSDGVWKCILITDILIFLLGAAVIFFALQLQNPLVCTGILTCICAVLRFVTAFLRPFAKKAAQLAESAAEEPEIIQSAEPIIDAEVTETVSPSE